MHKISQRHGLKPFTVKGNFTLFYIEYFRDLLLVGFGILLYLFLCHAFSYLGSTRGVTYHSSIITYQKQNLASQLLKMPHLAQEHCMSKVDIRGCWIKTCFYYKRFVIFDRLIQLGDKLFLVYYFNRTAVKLESLGYKRSSADGPRKMPGGQNLALRILTTAHSPGLAEKVVADAYSAVGIKVVYTRNADDPELNGALVGLRVDWPRIDFMNNYHSTSKGSQLIHPLADTGLDSLLESYSLSLTTAEPDFGQLRQIHAKIAKYEPVTVFMQNKLCMNVDNSLKSRLKMVKLTDPDWFKRFAM